MNHLMNDDDDDGNDVKGGCDQHLIVNQKKTIWRDSCMNKIKHTHINAHN